MNGDRVKRCVRYSIRILFLLYVLCTPQGFAETADSGVKSRSMPEITAEAAVMIDLDTGEVLYGKNEFQERPVASLTKVMTGYLLVKQHKKESCFADVVTISKTAADTGESSLNLKEEDQLTVENLLYGALLKSANDACVALAEHVSGSEHTFVENMNLQACLLGCANTHFENTNGLPGENHYSSAYDLALITRAAMQEVIFAKIVQTQQHTVTWQDGRQLVVHNTNRLLREYPGAIGVKTGTTNAAGQCLIAVAEKAGKSFVVVVLKSKNRFYDATVLLDYGFQTLDGLSAAKDSAILTHMVVAEEQKKIASAA